MTPIALVILAGLHASTGADMSSDATASLPTSLTLASAEAATQPGNDRLYGQAAKPPAEPEPGEERSPLSISLSGYGQVGARSDEKDNKGSLGVSKAGGNIGLGYRIDDTYTATLGLRTTQYYFSFDDNVRIGGYRKPFNDLNEYGIDPGLVIKIDEHWTAIAVGRFRWGGEPQNAFSHGFEGGGFGIANYKFSEELTLGFGIGATSRINESVLFIPFLSVDWKVAPNVTVRNRELGIEAVVKLSDQFSVIVGGEYEFHSFRLDQSSQISGGSVRDREGSVDIALAYTIVPNVVATVYGGGTIYRSIKLYNGLGNEIGTFEADPAPYAGVKLEVRF